MTRNEGFVLFVVSRFVFGSIDSLTSSCKKKTKFLGITDMYIACMKF